jgi:hypothetical protein
MKEKQVQIPLRLLEDLQAVFEGIQPLLGDSLHPDDKKYLEGIKCEINAKFEAMERRELFTRYKTAEPKSEIREYFRQRYLDTAGIHRDWRTGAETET